MTGGVESSGPENHDHEGAQDDHHHDRAQDQDEQREAAPDEAAPPEWARLRELLRHLPEPEWTQERADRIFGNILMALARRRRRRQLAVAAAGAVSVPLALFLASQIAPEH